MPVITPLNVQLLRGQQRDKPTEQTIKNQKLMLLSAAKVAKESGNKKEYLNALKRIKAFKEATKSKGALGFGSSSIEPLIRGGSSAFSDELQAGAKSVFEGARSAIQGDSVPISDLYEANINVLRGRDERFSEQNPVGSVVGDVAGGIATGAGVASAAPRLAASLPGLFATGGLFGGLRGAGEGEGAQDTVQKGLFGAGVGATTGLGLGVAGRGAKRFIIDPLRQALTPDKTAAQKVVQGALADDFFDEQSAMRELSRLGPRATIADLGDNTRQTLGAATTLSGRALRTSKNTLEERVKQAPTVIKKGLRTLLANDKNARTELAKIEAARRAQASPLYAQAHKELLQLDDELMPLVKKAGQSTYNKAMRIFNTDPDAPDVKWPKFSELEEGRTVPLAVLDYMKRALAGSSRRSGANAEMSRAEGALASRLTSALNKRSEAYNAGRQIYSDASKIRDALARGVKIFREEADDLADDIANMSRAEQDAFRTGALSAIEKELAKTNIGSDASRKLIRNEVLKSKLANAFPDKESVNAFVNNVVEPENIFAATRNAILRGSPTQPRQAAARRFIRDSAAKGIANDIQNRNFGNAAGKLLESIRGNDAGVEEIATEVARLMTAQGDDALAVINAAMKRAPKMTSKDRQVLETAFDIVQSQITSSQANKEIMPMLQAP